MVTTGWAEQAACVEVWWEEKGPGRIFLGLSCWSSQPYQPQGYHEAEGIVATNIAQHIREDR